MEPFTIGLLILLAFMWLFYFNMVSETKRIKREHAEKEAAKKLKQ